MKKTLSVFFALCIAGCILFTAAAFASDMPPLYISGDSFHSHQRRDGATLGDGWGAEKGAAALPRRRADTHPQR